MAYDGLLNVPLTACGQNNYCRKNNTIMLMLHNYTSEYKCNKKFKYGPQNDWKRKNKKLRAASIYMSISLSLR